MVLTQHGFDVTIPEKGRSFFGDLKTSAPSTKYSNDELKSNRSFAEPDPQIEPRTFRRVTDTTPRMTGKVQHLPQTVGGATVHWDAKTPRFCDIGQIAPGTLQHAPRSKNLPMPPGPPQYGSGGQGG